MKCKSCRAEIRSSDKYCWSCGGVIINERLSLRGTWTEFIGPFFSWDHNFRKTVTDLFTQPEVVLGSYISGARAKYFKPFSFLMVYATLALFYYKFFPFSNGLDTSGNNLLTEQSEIVGKMTQSLYDYYNFFIVITIPLMAFFSYVALKKYKNNYAEHLVMQCYIQSLGGYIAIGVQLIFLDLLKIDYVLFFSLFMLLTIVYCNYVFTRLYRLNIKSIILVNLKFFGIVLLVYLIITFGTLAVLMTV